MVSLIKASLGMLENEKQRENIDLLEICLTVCKGLIQGDNQLQEYLY